MNPIINIGHLCNINNHLSKIYIIYISELIVKALTSYHICEAIWILRTLSYK